MHLPDVQLGGHDLNGQIWKKTILTFCKFSLKSQHGFRKEIRNVKSLQRDDGRWDSLHEPSTQVRKTNQIQDFATKIRQIEAWCTD